jgi:Zn-finger nucleic acid-binding protein
MSAEGDAMRCPVCHVTLTTADRFGVEIDYCPKCWGVWLDRGELNLLFARQRSETDAAGDPLLAASVEQGAVRHPSLDDSFGNVRDFSWKTYVMER